MARTKGFSFLVLLPLILGSLLSFSKAELQHHKPHKHFEIEESFNTVPPIPNGFRKAEEQLSFLESDPPPISQAKFRSFYEKAPYPIHVQKPQNAFRGLQQRSFDEDVPATYGYGEADSRIGFRKSLVNEIRDVLDAFDKAYLENDKCEKLKEKISKVMGFIRVALDFVN